MEINKYYNRTFSTQEIESGAHRNAIGGLWDEIGKLQFNFMVEQGLEPQMKFLDVGCGCLRGGVYFIKYLNAGNYYGVDVNQSLLDAGYEKELFYAGLQDKMPSHNLLLDEHFQFSRFGVKFDFALALSVFTHLPLNHIRLCLIEVSKNLNPSGKFYASFFECPLEHPVEISIKHFPGEITTYTDCDPYHYKIQDLLWCIDGLSLEMNYIGDWKHPRAQRMVCFTKK